MAYTYAREKCGQREVSRAEERRWVIPDSLNNSIMILAFTLGKMRSHWKFCSSYFCKMCIIVYISKG
jgi:hypothetical protein